MIRRFITCSALMVLPAAVLQADFSYEQSSKITGGVMAGMMKVAGVFSKTAREPMRSTIAVKGDRMVTITGQTASVIDLSKETITEINYQRKQYSVMTFAEMAQMMEELAQKSKSKDASGATFKIDVQDTGQTRQINGMDTRQMIVKMVMEGTDAESGKSGGLVVTADMWLAPKVAGYEEITQFYSRMAQKMAWTPTGGLTAMAGPDASKALSELYKEGSKLNGIPVLQNIRMGAEGGEGGAQAGAGGQQAPAQQPQQQAEEERPSIGRALGGRLGGFGRFGRRKKQEEPEPQPQPQQQAAQPSGGQDSASGALLEMVTETTNFSSAPVDASKFEVPAGFKQVKPQRRPR